MQKISMTTAEAGMVLAADVFRADAPNGMPVCGKNTVLTDILVARLHTMGIKTLYVKGRPVGDPGEESLDELLHKLDRRFRKVLHEPLMAKLHEMHAEKIRLRFGDDDA